MTIRASLVALFAAFLGAVAVQSSRAEWTFQGLGTLGGAYSQVQALSADGSVAVGFSQTPTQDGGAFRWESGTLTAIGSPTQFAATAVSPDGSIVILQDYTLGAFRWENGVAVQLEFPRWASRCGGSDLSADGLVVVGGGTGLWFPLPPGTSPIVWGPPDGEGHFKARTLRDLGGLESFAYGVSADGSVAVGYSEDRSGNLKAVRWPTDWPQQLGTLGGAQSAAYGVSADGSVIVGWAERPDGLREPFRWEGGTMVGLGILPGEWQETQARAVSADGSVVVGYAQNKTPGGSLTFEPFIWDQAHGIRSLSELLTQNGIDLSDWDLRTAVDISADGRVIVGNGYHISLGRDEAWIASIPEPSTLTALATLAAVVLLAHLRRRRV